MANWQSACQPNSPLSAAWCWMGIDKGFYSHISDVHIWQICLHDKTTTSQFHHWSDVKKKQPTSRSKDKEERMDPPKTLFTTSSAAYPQQESPKWASISGIVALVLSYVPSQMQARNILNPNLIFFFLTTHSTLGNRYRINLIFSIIISSASPRNCLSTIRCEEARQICQATRDQQCGIIQWAIDFQRTNSSFSSFDDTCGFPYRV